MATIASAKAAFKGPYPHIVEFYERNRRLGEPLSLWGTALQTDVSGRFGSEQGPIWFVCERKEGHTDTTILLAVDQNSWIRVIASDPDVWTFDVLGLLDRVCKELLAP